LAAVLQPTSSSGAQKPPATPPHSPPSTPSQEVNELKATVEKSKNDVIKTVIGVLGTFSAVVFTATRLLSIAG
jgi:hypothetical protein